MNILLVGGCGYVGGYLTDKLILNGHDVVIYDNLMYESRFLKKVPFVYGDIREFDRLGKILNNFDIVIWLAALVGDGACSINPSLTDLLNYKCVKWIVDNFKKEIIFLSTCSVFGMNNDIINEDAPTNPLSKYAETKLKAEKYIVKNSNNYLIFRLGTLFGLGDEFSRLRLDLVTNILTLKATKKIPLTVFGGEQWRPLLHVKDVAEAVSFSVLHDIKGLYNLSYENFTIKEIAENIQKFIPGSELVCTDIKYEDLRNYKIDPSKFYATGWKPIYDLEYGIKEIHNVILENRIVNPNDPIYSNAIYLKERL